MKVEVLLLGGLRELAGHDDRTVSLDDPSLRRVADLLPPLRLPPGIVGLAMCGDRQLDWEDDLAEGMTVTLYPLVGGG
jgi:molybdopterin converting factor small subunit